MLRRAHRGTEFAARPKPFGASIFDNWTKRRTASHDTGRETRLRIIDASAYAEATADKTAR